ncbi:BadF/BadG/BcrA/BcrD ATPase family protein [Nonomuraea africana]|uniref:N-acetylglucosamine kinase-like BadF-type ATPase n=1 Tax=Nonomuraea africana TaxID=46171 RepID=A0ABR9KKS1_9ACTN|nr:BadF/BadG/BcrA/BcrD ATPase family protein [Nonomuraea africana]MBE1562609.1 N-acetylglucosamine kinase-like BadF-type ATPase [Nonomuraea africana]
MERGDIVIGVDAGATSTRVAVHALDGARLGYGTAGGGNPSAHGAEAAAAAIGTALARALDGLDPSRVSRSVAGVAGNALNFGAALDKLWADHGLAVGPRLMNDVPIAYAAGSAAPSGTLLLSGTGAVAARITAHDLDELSDGLGWLLGDAGSGFWIGRAGAKAVVHALDRGETGGPLSELIVTHFLGVDRGPTPRAEAERIVRLAQHDRTTLGPLATLVSRAAAEGDPMAVEIADRAAAHLAATVARVYDGGPIVLAGSVLTNEGPVRHAVQRLLEERWAARVVVARDGAGAAAWLAALELLPEGAAAALHPAFTG